MKEFITDGDTRYIFQAWEPTTVTLATIHFSWLSVMSDGVFVLRTKVFPNAYIS